MDAPGKILVLYGSQTFTAQEVAEKIWRTTKTFNFKGPVQAMDDYPISKLIHEDIAIFVCATTGQGDEPDNMKKFWKFLLRKSLPANSLEKLHFGVLGLGDSSYPKFNVVSKKLQKRLVQLGATPLVDIGLCDYQHDLGHDGVAIPWLKQFYNQLKKSYSYIETDNLKSTFTPRWKVSILKDNSIEKSDSGDIYFSKAINDKYIDPIQLEVKLNYRTTDKSHFQDVRMITLETTADLKLSYQPSDIINLRPKNCKEDINALFEIFEVHNLDIKPYYRLLVEELHEGKTFLWSRKFNK